MFSCRTTEARRSWGNPEFPVGMNFDKVINAISHCTITLRDPGRKTYTEGTIESSCSSTEH